MDVRVGVCTVVVMRGGRVHESICGSMGAGCVVSVGRISLFLPFLSHL